MSTTLDYNKIKEELVVFLRNQNVFTIAQRGVTTGTATGALIASATITISASNVKNIRSVTIGALPFTYGSQYTVNYNYNGTCVITLYAVQTDNYSVSYDYGSDKIYSDFPRVDLSLNSYPRIAVDIIGDASNDVDIAGEIKETPISFAIYVYDFKVDDIDTYCKTIKEKFLTAQKSFYYLKYIRRVRTSNPQLYNIYGNSKLMFKSLDYLSIYNYEFV